MSFLFGGGGSEPDPIQISQAQTTSNIETAIAQALLNQQSQVTPFGTTAFQQLPGINIPGISQQIPQFQRTETLSPLGQQQFDQQQRIANLLGGLAESNIGNVQQAQSQQFGFENFGAPTPQISRAPLGVSTQQLSQPPVPQAAGGQISNLLNQEGSLGGILGGAPQPVPFGGGGRRGGFGGGRRGGQISGGGFTPSAPVSPGIGGQVAPTLPTQAAPQAAIQAAPQAQAVSQGIPFADLAQIPQSAEAFSEQGRRAEESSFARALGLLNPEFARQQNLINVNLSERGLPPGSQAAQGVIDPFERRRNEALIAAAFEAQGAGRSEQERQLAQAFQARQQGIQERQLLRSQPINEIATLLGTAPGLAIPQFNPFTPTQVGQTDVVGAHLGAADIAQQQRGGLLGGLFDLGSSVIANPSIIGDIGRGVGSLFSDIRLKENIKPYGFINGHKLYSYNYIWDDKPQIGVMAQEIEKVIPEAVMEIAGFKAVNYDMVM